MKKCINQFSIFIYMILILVKIHEIREFYLKLNEFICVADKILNIFCIYLKISVCCYYYI